MYRDNYDRIFGKKALPHGRKMTDAERDEEFKRNVEEGFNELIAETNEKKVKFSREVIPPGTAKEIKRWLEEQGTKIKRQKAVFAQGEPHIVKVRPQTATEALCPCTGCPVHQPDENDCHDCDFPDFPEEEI